MKNTTLFSDRPQRAGSPSGSPADPSAICAVISARGPLPTWLFVDRSDLDYCARLRRRRGEAPVDVLADRIIARLNRLVRNPSRLSSDRIYRLSEVPMTPSELRRLRSALRLRAESAKWLTP